jgi:hypothetical protein
MRKLLKICLIEERKMNIAPSLLGTVIVSLSLATYDLDICSFTIMSLHVPLLHILYACTDITSQLPAHSASHLHAYPHSTTS